MDYLGNNELHAIWLSVKVAFVSLIFLIPIGLLISHLLSRKEFYGRSFLDALVHLPLVLPPVVTGYFLLILFGRSPGASNRINFRDWARQINGGLWAALA